ncbi:MAG: calcium-binding protein [Dechloromonas sp.]|nr:calcium-binding protein [Dechloromonas sp.]
MAQILTRSNALPILTAQMEDLVSNFEAQVLVLEALTDGMLTDLATAPYISYFDNSQISLGWSNGLNYGMGLILGSGFGAVANGGRAVASSLDLSGIHDGRSLGIHMSGGVSVSLNGLGGYVAEASIHSGYTSVLFRGRVPVTTGTSAYSSIELTLPGSGSELWRLTLTGQLTDNDFGELSGTVTGMTLSRDSFGSGYGFGTVLSVSGIAVPVDRSVGVDDVGAFLGHLFSGDDSIEGTSGVDTLYGYSGDDILDGKAGADTLTGGVGDDTYVIDDLGDQIIELEGQGSDAVHLALFAASGNFTLTDNVENGILLDGVNWSLTGNDLDNYLRGNALDNTLSGGDGDDVLDGKGGADLLTGGEGDDVYIIESLGDTLVEESDAGHDLVRVGIRTRGGSFTLADNVEDAVLTAPVAFTLVGNELDNSLTGNYRTDSLLGGAGDDVLDGRRGADRLAGGAGNDALRGGAGADQFVFDSALNGVSNVDQVLDFAAGDRLVLDDAIFGALAGGVSAAHLASGAGLSAATTASQHLLYDTTSGSLYYDADGAGGSAATLFAVLHLANGIPPPHLAASDFIVS